ncbi:hypothetical protein LP414_09380 [Polaromonas sp. P1(28)-13]|nr:hypothetical protein LP414_09380 [Polaromonas sp. P1(28)-13]
MQVDIVGRVNNLQLPLSQPFIPLFECLVNSIESIEDSKIADGRIDVHFIRDTAQASVAGTEDGAISPIRDITIIDNGAGFDDVNVRAFFMSDSTRKANRGNKGIGRFTWLKVFGKANIDSVYKDGDLWFRRTFSFTKTTDGVEGENVEPTDSNERKTSVTLNVVRPEYEKHFPKSLDTIGHKVIDHLLIHFVSGSCPKITLHDNNGDSLNLNHVFSEEAKERGQDVKFAVRGHEFKATVLRYQSSAAKTHTVSYCANHREVLTWKASKAEPDLTSKFTDDQGQSFVFRTYISGPYLDSKVSSERTNFMFLQEEDLEFPEEMTRAELDVAVIGALHEVAEPYMSSLKMEKRQAIETFVQNKAPQFRFQLQERYRERLERISPNLSEEQLDVELYKTQRDIEVEHRQRFGNQGGAT